MFASVQKYSKLVSICKITLKKSVSIIISAFHHPPNCASNVSAKCVVDELSSICMLIIQTEFWVSGDFNLPDIDWSNLTI